MTVTSIDPHLAKTALEMAKAGRGIGTIADATGLLPNEIRRLLDGGGQQRLLDAPARPTTRPSPLIGPPATHETIRLTVGQLHVDAAYQRDVNLRWVLGKVKEFDRALLGVLEVSDRGIAANPRYFVVDGRHRRELVIAVEGEKASVLCHVHRGLTVEDEARLFGQIDSGRRRLTGWDRWKARRAAGDPDVLAVEAVVARAGLRLVNNVSNGKTRAAVCSTHGCEEIVALGGLGLLHETLVTCTSAFGDKITFDRDVITGVASVLHVYPRDELEVDRLVEGMASILPIQLKARARARRELHKGSAPRLVAGVIVDLVNEQGGGRKRLEPFEQRVPAGGGRGKAISGSR